VLALTGPLMSTIVLPYLGPAVARRELTRPVAHATPQRINGSVPASSGGGVLGADPFKAAGMRLTYRTVRVLMAIAEHDGASNRLVGAHAGIADQGQISKLLHRLQRAGLVENTGLEASKGMPNAWSLTGPGARVAEQLVLNTKPPKDAK
jgi:hypothetical protein